MAIVYLKFSFGLDLFFMQTKSLIYFYVTVRVFKIMVRQNKSIIFSW